VTGITRAVCRIIRHGVVCVAASAESQVRCNDKAAVNVYTAGSNEALDKEVHVSAPGVKVSTSGQRPDWAGFVDLLWWDGFVLRDVRRLLLRRCLGT
jgi:hypothetical protein